MIMITALKIDNQISMAFFQVLQGGFSSMPVSVPVNSYGSDNSSLEGHHGSSGYQIPVSPGGHLSVDGSSPRQG